jgi:hypothetical protein
MLMAFIYSKASWDKVNGERKKPDLGVLARQDRIPRSGFLILMTLTTNHWRAVTLF